MPQPFGISFGPWVPDGADAVIGMPYQYAPTTLPLADCLNVYWRDGAYRNLPSAVGAGTAMASQCLGAMTVVNSSGGTAIYAGDSSDLFVWNGSGFTNVSKSAGAYAGTTFWSFAEFAGCILGVNGVNLLQDMSIGGSAFADIAGSPIAGVCGVIGQFLLVGDIGGSPAYPYRVMWPAISDPTNWPTPLTDAAVAVQSSYEDLEQDFGRVMFIAGGPQQGVIFQQLGITRATYVGGDVVFQFSPFERKRGLIARGAAVQVGDVTHFLASDGFYMTDGSSVQPTGSATDGSIGLDKWFRSNVNLAALNTIRAAYDATLKCLAFAIPTGSNTLPDTLLLFNPTDGRWTRAAMSCELIWSDLQAPASGALQHSLGLFNQSHEYASLSGANLTGYAETYDGSFLDGLVRDVIEVQPNILCTDTPTARVGYRQALQDAITYTSDNSQDAFSRRVTFDPPPAGRFLRVRVTSAAAQALNGATIFVEQGGL